MRHPDPYMHKWQDTPCSPSERNMRSMGGATYIREELSADIPGGRCM